ncbi:MAG: polysaccharide pyruvyl transferase family protein [Nitrosomonas sp.]|nr:polysaccharide pyruvyl transferase family protein [Nitrosomonas sp.]
MTALPHHKNLKGMGIGNMKTLLFGGGFRYKKNNGINVGDIAQFENAILLLKENIPNIEITAIAHSLNDECVDESIPISRVLSEYLWGDQKKTIIGRIKIVMRSLSLLLNAKRVAAGKKCIFLSAKGIQALREFYNIDFLFYSGAGTLNSMYFIGPVYIWILAMLLARRLKVPYILLGQQIGPLDTRLSRWILKIALNGATFVGVRDQLSHQLASELGVTQKKLGLTGDEGIYLPPGDRSVAGEFLDKLNIPRDYIAVQFRLDSNCPFHEYIEDFARLYSDVAKALKKPLVFIPFSYANAGDDREAHKLISEKINAPYFLLDIGGQTQFTKAILSMASLAIGIANHFCAFAASVGVPTVGFHGTSYMCQKLEGLKQGRQHVISLPLSELSDTEKLSERIVLHANENARTERLKSSYNQRPEGYWLWADRLAETGVFVKRHAEESTL